MYFPMRTAIARLGGIAEASRALNVPAPAIDAWVRASRRSKPSDELLERLSELTGVSVDAFHLYYRNLETYKANEHFRRRRPG